MGLDGMVSRWMPSHPIVKEFGMTRRRYEFLWRHFHPSFELIDEKPVEESTEEEDEDDEQLITIGFERIQLDENNHDSDPDDDLDEDTGTPQDKPNKNKKVCYPANNVRKFSSIFG